MSMPLLEVDNLVTSFHTGQGVVRAVRGISWTLAEGEALAIVGESGSGKTVSALSVMRLVSEPPGRIESGQVRLRGRDLLQLPEAEMRRVRGREIGMIFQDPMTSLNPVLTIGRQLTEATRRHLGLSLTEATDLAVETLALVGIPRARDRLGEYPHRLSGGQRQRVMIAMALACRPSVLIADEPTTALDVTIQAQIVELVRDLRARLGMAVLWITHDLALVAGFVDTVAVMYAGRIVEQAPVRDLFRSPRHPYTLGLLKSLPRMEGGGRRLHSIPGLPPDLREEAVACAFAPRCPYVVERCRHEVPPEMEAGERHMSACLRWSELAEEAAKA
jgi:oligopeptide/dipeptide ABC transporter ATP-binding protein